MVFQMLVSWLLIKKALIFFFLLLLLPQDDQVTVCVLMLWRFLLAPVLTTFYVNKIQYLSTHILHHHHITITSSLCHHRITITSILAYLVLSSWRCQLLANVGATVCELSLGLSDHKSEFWRGLRHPVMIILHTNVQCLDTIINWAILHVNC